MTSIKYFLFSGFMKDSLMYTCNVCYQKRRNLYLISFTTSTFFIFFIVTTIGTVTCIFGCHVKENSFLSLI